MRHLRKACFCLVLLLCAVGLAAQGRNEPTFPAWSTEVQTWDSVTLLGPEAKARIAGLQKTLRDQHGVGLWVVLLDSQRPYTEKPTSIEAFAASLVQQKIRPLAGNDKFILLLVCKEDRKSRIELGADWNHQWNEGCDLITQNALVANFKRGDYERGIVEAVEALAEMTAAKNKPPPLGEAGRLSAKWGSQLGAYSYLPAVLVVPVGLLGLLLLLAGLLIARHRNSLAGGAMVIITLALFSQVVVWIVVIAGLIYLLSRANWSGGGTYSSWGGSSSSGSFDSSSGSSFFDSSSSSFSSDSFSSGDSGWSGGGGSTGEW